MIITISGHYGSGGLWVGKKAAELLNYRFLDDETAKDIIKGLDLDLTPEDYMIFDENSGENSLDGLRLNSSIRSSSPFAHYFEEERSVPLQLQFIDALKHLARDFAKDGNCVLVGRCAGYFLKPNPDLICFFTTDADEIRIRRTMDYYGCDEKAALKRLKKRDKRRSEYNKFFTESSTWGDPAHYDYILHTNTLGIEGTARLIQSIVEIRESEGTASDRIL